MDRIREVKCNSNLSETNHKQLKRERFQLQTRHVYTMSTCHFGKDLKFYRNVLTQILKILECTAESIVLSNSIQSQILAKLCYFMLQNMLWFITEDKLDIRARRKKQGK